MLDELLEEIRTTTVLKDFLLGPSPSDIMKLANGRSIIVFNVSEIRSDAFIVTSDSIRLVELPLLEFQDLEDRSIQFSKAIEKHDGPGVEKTLEWLWDKAVRPVLTALGCCNTRTAPAVQPRVSWIASGKLYSLPLHVAGYHHARPCRTALDLVISSYSPTLRALSYAMERASTTSARVTQKALIVTMAKTEGIEGELPGVKSVSKSLPKKFANWPDTKALRQPNRQTVLSCISEYNIVHFACHGSANPDPLRSSLLLEDWKKNPLTVLDLMSFKPDKAEFAFLHACETSVTRDPTLLDESISLAVAVHLSGYYSVVGTLWPVYDNCAQILVQNFYDHMLPPGRRIFHCRASAETLNKCIRSLRTQIRENETREYGPILWAALIHIGVVFILG
jgi:CHAT domain